MLDPKDIECTPYKDPAHGNCSWMQSSGMTIMHIPTNIGVTVNSERSQYQNKEKALALLESLLLLLESEKHYQEEQAAFQARASIPNKVQMIKDVRARAGCGLKEAKEAVDLHMDVDLAVLHIIGLAQYKSYPYEGYCRMGDNCLCEPEVRRGCFEWKTIG